MATVYVPLMMAIFYATQLMTTVYSTLLMPTVNANQLMATLWMATVDVTQLILFMPACLCPPGNTTLLNPPVDFPPVPFMFPTVDVQL